MKKLNRKSITTIAVFALILVLNIVMLCLPAFGAYKGSVKSDSVTTTYTLEYKGNSEIKCTTAMKSSSSESKNSGTTEVKYNATDKKWETPTLKATVTKRNSVFAHTYYPATAALSEGVKVTSTLAIVMQVVFAIGYVVCIALFVLDLNGGKGKKRSRR